MSLHDYLKSFDKSPKVIKVTESEEPAKYTKTDEEYFYTMNEDTGLRYDIPMLSTMDPAYVFKYVSYMKQREQNEETFNKMLNWE